jgi:undecaprenyl diphosphate synthase
MMHEHTAPQCVGIILDGNRRWAKEHGKTSFEGHSAGMDNVEPIARALRDRGAKHMAVYAFSTENWQRAPEEVSYLLGIFETMIREKLADLHKENIAVRFAGQLERFPEGLRQAMADAEAGNPKDPDMTLWACLSYGGRADIVQAARALQASGQEITEESLRARLWTADLPDADIIIRTSGEQRLSNFLMWQSAYSELFFVQKHWPAFSVEDLDAVLAEYAQRERRMGK